MKSIASMDQLSHSLQSGGVLYLPHEQGKKVLKAEAGALKRQ